MNKKLIAGGVVVGVVIAAVIGIRMRGRQFSDGGTEYTTVKIERGDIVNTITSTGTLEPVSVVDVGTQVSGIIDKIYVDFNDTVTKGQLIAELDRTFLSGALDEATASCNRAQALYDLAKAEFERNGPLHEKGYLSDEEFAQIRTEYVTQKASLQSAEAAVKKARINLNYATITSPITGTVIERSIEAGQTVAASLSAPTLFVIAEDLKRMQILANVDEADIGGIQQGQEVQFTVQAYPDRKFDGNVEQVRLQPTVSQNVVTYTVVITTENGDGALLPGMTATVDFIIEKAANVLRIPNAALRFKPFNDSLMKRMPPPRRHDGAGDSGNNRFGPPGAFAGGGERPRPEGRREKGMPGMPGTGEGSPEEPDTGRSVVWLSVSGGEQFRPAFVRTGITDGVASELVEGMGIEEGTEIITGTKAATGKKTKKNVSLLPQTGPPGRRR